MSFTIITTHHSEAQADSTAAALQNLPSKYLKEVGGKIEKYNNRIRSKTEKTLARLSRWENKIQLLLQKVDPEAARRLFGNGQTSFSTLLRNIEQGKEIADNYKAKYDDYRDKLTTSLKYLDRVGGVDKVIKVEKGLEVLEENVRNSEALEEFIRQRKKQLMDEAFKYIGKSKYLSRISKESWYYVETLRNYKEIFGDKKKAEETALKILNRIPAFEKFAAQNSILGSLFNAPPGYNPQNLEGLQTRASVNTLIQSSLYAGGSNARQIFNQHMQQAQAELNQIRDKIIQAGGNYREIPDFKPTAMKTKTSKQRLELGTDLQFVKSNSVLPSIVNLGITLGYKLNDKSVIGLGASYKMGMGTLQHISITHQGIGLRSFVDWKMKKQFFISGGFEMNYLPGIDPAVLNPILRIGDWQKAGLIGLSKKIPLKTKFSKCTKLQLLYDILARTHIPLSQPVIFRIGYQF